MLALLSYVITAAAGYAMWWLWSSGVVADTFANPTNPERN